MRVFGLTVGKRVKDLKTEVSRLRRDIKQKDAARCEPTDEHRKAVVRTQPSVTLDETGWRIGGHPAWLHVAATADATVYGIFAGRGVDASQAHS